MHLDRPKTVHIIIHLDSQKEEMKSNENTPTCHKQKWKVKLPVLQANLGSMVCQKGEPTPNVSDLPAHSDTKEAHAKPKNQ